jgi:hypothetical protein
VHDVHLAAALEQVLGTDREPGCWNASTPRHTAEEAALAAGFGTCFGTTPGSSPGLGAVMNYRTPRAGKRT